MTSELEHILENLGFEEMPGGNWHKNEEYVVTEVLGSSTLLYRVGTHHGVDHPLMQLSFVPNTPQKAQIISDTIKLTLGL